MGPCFLLTLCLSLLCAASTAEEICNIHCDGRDTALALESRVPATVQLLSRTLSLVISDPDNMGSALLENGSEGDEVWLDRSFDGGKSWADGSRLGNALVPPASAQVQTLLFNVDDPSQLKIGALRACGKTRAADDIACTEWARSTFNADTPLAATATALMQFYQENGLFDGNGWWTGANAVTAIIDYSRLTGLPTYEYMIEDTFLKNKDKEFGNFTNTFVDDTLWWGLAWLGAFELTGETKYLEMAVFDADFAYSYKDEVCGGGLYWKTDRLSKNAIQNELFIKLAAALHNHIPGDTKYLGQAVEVWDWFNRTGFINSEGLVNDGIRLETCSNNGDVTWTYNQGVIVGGLVELFKATGEQAYISQARTILDAVVNSDYLTSPELVLTEPCEANESGCGADGPSFKGAAMRNFGDLNRILPGRPYAYYMESQVRALTSPNSHNAMYQYGIHYAGPFDGQPIHSSQHSALEAYTAALG